MKILLLLLLLLPLSLPVTVIIKDMDKSLIDCDFYTKILTLMENIIITKVLKTMYILVFY